MLIIDGHLDLSMNALRGDRDLLQSVYTIRAQENRDPRKGRALGTVAFPEMRQGRIALTFATLIARSTGHPVPQIDYRSPTQAYGMAHGQLAYYRALAQKGHIRIVTDRAGLDSHMAEWQAWDEAADFDHTPPLGFVISMEGADPILEPEQLEAWWEAGLRLLGPTHYGRGPLRRRNGHRNRPDRLGPTSVSRNGPAGPAARSDPLFRSGVLASAGPLSGAGAG